MPIITRWVDDGSFSPDMLFETLAELRSTVRLCDQRDAFWLIHPDTWERIVRAAQSIEPVPHSPDRRLRLLGLPLDVRDDGQPWREIQLWAENHIERAMRRNPNTSISVSQLRWPEWPTQPASKPPTLRAVLAKWVRRLRRKAAGS